MHIDVKEFHNLYMPFFTNGFFFVSGYLLLSRQWNDNYISKPFSLWFNKLSKGSGLEVLRNILYRIAIPTVIFSSLLFVPKIALRGVAFEVQTFLHDTLFGGSIWFTSSLAVSELIILLLLASRIRFKTFYVLASLLLTLIAVWCAKDANGMYGTADAPWFWKGGFIATLFLVGGGIYQKYEAYFHKICGRPFILGFGVLLYLTLAIAFGSEMAVSINVGAFNLIGAFMSFFSIIFVIEICRLVPYHKYIEYLGRHTLVLYFMSGAIPNVISIVFLKFIGDGIVAYAVCSILSFCTAIPITIIVNKYLPFLIDVRKIRKYGL